MAIKLKVDTLIKCGLNKSRALSLITREAYVKVEMLDLEGNRIKDFEVENSKEIIGNEIEKAVTWKDNPDLKKLNDLPVRLRFVMKDADLYSIWFK